MGKNKVYYLGFYGDEQAYSEGRYLFPAGVNKMDYIARAMSEAGLEVDIVSAAWLKYDRGAGVRFAKQRTVNVCENVSCTLTPSFTFPLRLSKPLARLFSSVWLMFYLLFNIRKGDKVVVYHSPFYINTIYRLKRLIRFNLTIEVEEVYAYAFNQPQILKKELKFISSADKWILVNDLIGATLGLDKNNYTVCYGQYKIESKDVEAKIFDDHKIHLVYAGSLGNYKGGAQNAIEAARFLSDKYTLHILGRADGQTLHQLLGDIEEVNSLAMCKVKYEGCMFGDNYASFMKGCDIGLNPQRWGDYMLYAYPSKTLSYLCLGLRVVTSPLKTLKVSKLNDLFVYTEQESPESIARAIMSIDDFDKQKPIDRIAELHTEFVGNLKKILN